MVFVLPRKLRGGFRPFKDVSQGRRNCDTFRDSQRDREWSHVCNRSHVFMYIYRHNYISLKKELERQNHGGGVCPKGCAIVAHLETFQEIENRSCGQKDVKRCHVFLNVSLYNSEERAREAKPCGVCPQRCTIVAPLETFQEIQNRSRGQKDAKR